MNLLSISERSILCENSKLIKFEDKQKIITKNDRDTTV